MMRPCGEELKIYLYRMPIDMRKGRNGLAALAQEAMKCRSVLGRAVHLCRQAIQRAEDLVLGAQRLCAVVEEDRKR